MYNEAKLKWDRMRARREHSDDNFDAAASSATGQRLGRRDTAAFMHRQKVLLERKAAWSALAGAKEEKELRQCTCKRLGVT